MEIKIEDKDLYGLLNVESTASENEIKKAYRKKALSCHPDKNPDNPNAAALFHELSLALQILVDLEARKAYDKVLNAKKAAEIRHRELDTKRKKLKEDLDARERLAELRVKETKTDEEKLQAEIERLRKEGAKIVQEENEYLKQHLTNTFQNFEPVPWDSTKYRIKIKWKAEKKDPNNGGYGHELLQRFLSKYGDIEGFVISPKKSGSAMVEFRTQEAAEMAINYEKGLPENPLTLSWINGPPPKVRLATSTSTLIKDSDFESIVMHKLRQAEERKRLIEELQRSNADD